MRPRKVEQPLRAPPLTEQVCCSVHPCLPLAGMVSNMYVLDNGAVEIYLWAWPNDWDYDTQK